MIRKENLKRDIDIAIKMVNGARGSEISRIYGITSGRANQIVWRVARCASHPRYDLYKDEKRRYCDKRESLAEIRDNKDYWIARIRKFESAKAA